ncbi:SHOCT domain-containing protein [Halomicroarcula sp. GCM10025709]|uniref:SHOCT domain-containing protein n=1 Tax=Haloarcula TaxID=2237 RepID=UPI0024C22B10|nr:SHOCT domain-containing protein [Halomicroarcula sp. YJ-61-S]
MTTSERRLAAVVVLILGALFVLPVLVMSFGMLTGGTMGGGMYGGGMWGTGMHGSGMAGGGGGGPGWLWGLGLVVPVLFVAGVVGLGYLLVRSIGTDGDDDPAVEQLRRTYASGELSDEEFERRLERLREE